MSDSKEFPRIYRDFKFLDALDWNCLKVEFISGKEEKIGLLDLGPLKIESEILAKQAAARARIHVEQKISKAAATRLCMINAKGFPRHEDGRLMALIEYKIEKNSPWRELNRELVERDLALYTDPVKAAEYEEARQAREDSNISPES